MPHIARIDVENLEDFGYVCTASCGGVELLSEAGFPSIRRALEGTAGLSADFVAFEVAYRGIVIGTYPASQLQVNAESIADCAVRTVAALES